MERKWALLGLDKSDSDEASNDSDVDRLIGKSKRKMKTDGEGKDITIWFKSGFDGLEEKI